MNEDNQPKGIGFFNIKSGETHYARLEPQIQAYINSSDMGINASRDQDFGWRLEPEWVKRVKDFRRNEAKMERLVANNGGQKVTVPQILYKIYGEQLRAYEQQIEDHEAPFEEEYLSNISDKKPSAPIPNDEEEGIDDGNGDTSTDSAPSAAEPVQEVNAASNSDQPADSPKEPSATKAPGTTKKK